MLVSNLTLFDVFAAGTVKPGATCFPHTKYRNKEFDLVLDGEVLKSPGHEWIRKAEIETNSIKRSVVERQADISVVYTQITFEIIS